MLNPSGAQKWAGNTRIFSGPFQYTKNRPFQQNLKISGPFQVLPERVFGGRIGRNPTFRLGHPFGSYNIKRDQEKPENWHLLSKSTLYLGPCSKRRLQSCLLANTRLSCLLSNTRFLSFSKSPRMFSKSPRTLGVVSMANLQAA